MNPIERALFYGRLSVLFPVLVADSKIKKMSGRCRELERQRLSFLEQIADSTNSSQKGQALEDLKSISDNLDQVFYDRWKMPVKNHYLKPHFENIIVGGAENLNQAKDEVLVIVSRHFSLDDFMLQGIVFHDKDVSLPVYSAGANLLGSALRDILKGWGAVSIDRTKKRDPLHLKMIKSYFTYILANGRNAVIYPEEGRTRNGRMKSLKNGLLNSAIDAYSVNPEKKYKVIPSAVSYERVREDSIMTRTRPSGEKKGILRRLEDIWDSRSYLGADCGEAYVTFGEPFYLNDLTAEDNKDNRISLAALRGRLEKELKRTVKIPISAMIAYSQSQRQEFSQIVRSLEGKADIDHPLLKSHPRYILNSYLQKPYIQRMIRNPRLVDFYANMVRDVL